MSAEDRLTELIESLFKNGVLPNRGSVSTIDVVDFYARLGYIWRLRGTLVGAGKISLVTPAFTLFDRFPMSAPFYDGVTDLTIYEGGSAATDGSTIYPLNALRTTLRESFATCKTGVTYADDGTILESWTGAKEKSPNLELWYLKPSTQYVFKFSAATNYRLQWAEVY